MNHLRYIHPYIHYLYIYLLLINKLVAFGIRSLNVKNTDRMQILKERGHRTRI